MVVQQTAATGFHLDLPSDVMSLLRRSAMLHGRRVGIEALAVLWEALFPDRSGLLLPATLSSTHLTTRTALYVELPDALVERIRGVADGSYRSVAGQTAVILQAVLRQCQGKLGPGLPPSRGRPPKK